MEEKQPPQYDTIYQTFDKGLYKRTANDTTNSLMSMINADPNANQSTSTNVPADLLGGGMNASSATIDSSGITVPVGGSFPGISQTLNIVSDTISYYEKGVLETQIHFGGNRTDTYGGSDMYFILGTREYGTGKTTATIIFDNQLYFILGGHDINAGILYPESSGVVDLGFSGGYWNDVSYKTLTDRGCLGWFDEGVEMQDGTKISDTAAIRAVKVHPTKKTVYGVPMLDYSTMPKAVFKPAQIAREDILDRRTGRLRWKKGEKVGVDGAETTALISIMFGAIKELTGRVEALEALVKSTGPKENPVL